ncbi:hypothetical protein FB451DRAFT_1309878 [Mycena latifolia]|nr:hypothetical protein FB451DRAFT_1309878 [Mycena latifolia]
MSPPLVGLPRTPSSGAASSPYHLTPSQSDANTEYMLSGHLQTGSPTVRVVLQCRHVSISPPRRDLMVSAPSCAAHAISRAPRTHASCAGCSASRRRDDAPPLSHCPHHMMSLPRISSRCVAGPGPVWLWADEPVKKSRLILRGTEVVSRSCWRRRRVVQAMPPSRKHEKGSKDRKFSTKESWET